MVMSKGDAIDARGISFSYPATRLLHEISITAAPGTITTLAGPNGCGKTTLLKLLSGHLKPDSGTIVCAGLSIPDCRPSVISQRLGYVPQSGVSSFPYSVFDVVLCGRIPYLQPWENPTEKDIIIARDCMNRLGIDHLKDQIYSCLSGGERQLVMIARSLCQDPEVLLLDEPTSFLDLKNQIQVLEMIHHLAVSERMTVVMTLHDPNHAYQFSDQVVLMKRCHNSMEDENNIVSFGNPEEVMTQDNIFAAYGIHVDMIPYRRRNIFIPYTRERFSGEMKPRGGDS